MGPTVWSIRDTDDHVLANGRRGQLGHNAKCIISRRVSGGRQDVVVTHVDAWEMPPHAAFFVPFCAGNDITKVPDEDYALYSDTLLLLTALDGGEAVLDSIVNNGAGSVAFLDRTAWRARIHLPEGAWPSIERIIRWAERPGDNCKDVGNDLLGILEDCMAAEIVKEEFGPERIDIQLDPGDEEAVRAIRLFKDSDVSLPQQLLLSPSSLCSHLCVRIGQLNQWATGQTMKEIVAHFPRWDSARSLELMRQVAAVFSSSGELDSKRQGSIESQPPSIVVLPEVAVPQSEVRTVRDLVAKTGSASLAGLYWRVLPPVYRGNDTGAITRRWVVNEAELAIPIGHNEPGPTSVRWFRVRKPFPAHVENGMARALRARNPGVAWRVLGGQRWYRFVHGTWGDFAVAVCADLLDPEPWRLLCGEVLHLFMVAFNPDVDLYEALTWTRTYETYANVVAVNHGMCGGSFLWTPQRRHGRELARLRGRELFLAADVELPVAELLEEQREGIEKAVDRAACGSKTYVSGHHRYKAPPPGYQRGALSSE